MANLGLLSVTAGGILAYFIQLNFIESIFHFRVGILIQSFEEFKNLFLRLQVLQDVQCLR